MFAAGLIVANLFAPVSPADADEFPLLPGDLCAAYEARRDWLRAQAALYPDECQRWQRLAERAERCRYAAYVLNNLQRDRGHPEQVYLHLEWLRLHLGRVHYAQRSIPWLWNRP